MDTPILNKSDPPKDLFGYILIIHPDSHGSNLYELGCNQSVLIIIDFGSDCLRLLRLLQLHVLATIEYYC